MNKKKIVLPITLLALLVVLLNSIYTVKENEYGVVRQFGLINHIDDTPGLKIKIPFIQSVDKLSKAIIFYDIPQSDVITKDKKSMVVDSFVLWRVSDPTALIRTLNGIYGRAEERIEAATYNAIKNTISSMTQDELIASRGESLTNKITQEANNGVTSLGIEIVTAQIKTLSLPNDNQNAVYERMISERENIAAGYQATGQADAQKIRNETDKEVEIKLAEAKKEADVLIAEGEEEYMKILQDAYNSAEKGEFYEYVRGIDSLKQSLRGTGRKTIILDGNSELVKILQGAN